MEGIKSPPNVAMAKGTGVHKSAELNYLNVIEGKDPLSVDEVQQNASEAFTEATEDIEVWEQNKGEALDQTVTAAEKYHNVYGTTVKPIAAEQWHEITHPDWIYKVVGIIDLETELEIPDIKVTGKKKPASEVEKSLAGGIYRKMVPGKEFIFHNVILGKNAIRTETIKADFISGNDDKIDGYITAMQFSIAQSMNTGVFAPAAADSWGCNSRFCGYYNRCEHGGK